MDSQEFNYLLNYLESHPEYLNALQVEYISSVKKLYRSTGVLTKRQVECLYDMKEYIPSRSYKSESENYQAQYSSFDNLSPFYM